MLVLLLRQGYKLELKYALPALDTYAAGGLFGQYKMMQKTLKMTKTLAKVVSESFLMSTNTTGFGWLSKKNCILDLWMKFVLALEGLKGLSTLSFSNF